MAQETSDEEAGKETVLPLVEEQVMVGKRQIETAKVRVSKVVSERQQLVEQALKHETVDIERVPRNIPVAAAPDIRREGDTVVIPVLEERLVVEKHLILKEEIRLTMHETSVPHAETVTLRSEDITVDRQDIDNPELNRKTE